MKDIKRLLCFAAGIILAISLACGISLWADAREIKRQTDQMHALSHILTFAESKGADWATDVLMIDGVERFCKKSLYQKWGKPAGNTGIANEDIWILSDQFQLVVQYDDHDRVERVKVIPRS